MSDPVALVAVATSGRWATDCVTPKLSRGERLGLLDVLLGRSKLRKPNRERYFSIVTAEMTLRGRTDLRLTDKAGIVFNPVESTFFENLNTELRDLLRISGDATGTSYEIVDDDFGTRWVVLDDRDFEDLVSTLHLVGETITEHGFGDRLLAAVFGFEYERKPAYWVYNIKRGNFYPIVLAAERERDNTAEIRLSALMEEEKIPVESSLENWYALWGIPF